MKRILLTLLLTLGTSIYIASQTHEGTCGSNLTWTLNVRDSILTISGSGPMTNWTSSSDVPWGTSFFITDIATVIINEGVTSIGDYAFSTPNNPHSYHPGNFTKLTTINIPNSATSIGAYAFQNCSSLTSITIPNSVINIGDYAFSGCSGLTSITIPNSVTSIGNYAFRNCSGLTSITIPNSVTSIGYGAFYGCSGLTSVTIPNSVTSIGVYAFQYCSGLTSVTIPNSVTSIGNYAFEYCSGLTSITIPDSVTSIGNYAFRNCSGLTYITIPNSVTSIGYYAFSDCSGLTSVTIPNSVTSIGNGAFSDCRGLTSVTIPNSVTNIGSSAFSNCSSLVSVSIPNSVTSLGSSAFSKCSSLVSVTIPNSVTSIGSSAFSNCSSLTSITIPNSVTNIGSSAFSNCSSLTSITIPNSVTSIGGYAFQKCSSLTSINIPNSVTSIGNNVFKDCASLPVENNLRYADNYLVETDDITLASYSIKSGTKWIGGSAFANCSSLTSIAIPNSVTNIGNSAFSSCSSLTSITIPNGVNNIETNAFYRCSSLTTVSIPISVTSIGDAAFGCCDALSQVYVHNPTPITISGASSSSSSNVIFYTLNESDCVIPDNLNIYVPCGTLNSYKTATCWSDYASRMDILPLPNIAYNTNDSSRGIVDAFTPQTICDSVVLTAVSNYGYYLTQWSDNSTLNPYVLYLTHDTTITAIFEKNAYTLQTRVNNPQYGSTIGDTTALYLDTLNICAIPDSECYFVQWSDGNMDNPRRIVLTKDSIFTAVFERLYFGQCGDSLYWSYNSDTLTFSGRGEMYNYSSAWVPWTPHNQTIREITFAPEMTSIGDNAFKGIWGLTNVNIPAGVAHIGESSFNGCTGLHHLTIPNSVTSLGSRAFANCTAIDSLIIGTGITHISDQFYWCSNLRYLILGQNVEEIEHGAFMDARRLSNIVCHAAEPPTAYPDEASGQRSFYNVHALVLIPCDNFSAYQHDALWGSFDLQCLSSESGIATDGVVTVVAGDADATFTWPTSATADSYTLQITKDDEVFCTLTFNSIGQLLGIAFAPARDGSIRQTPQATLTTNGMKFQVTGLDYASHYNFSFDTKNIQKQTVFAYSGWFSTNGATGINEISSEQSVRPLKIFEDGEFYILLPDGTRYDATGKKVE